MKKEYIIFKKYNGLFDGYLWIVNNYHETTMWKQCATLLTLKQAQKICFDKNQELKKYFSYGTIWGYEKI
jgi:hypothetical protein